MKKELRRILVSSIFLLSLIPAAFAADIAVSITIPAIPGVNAPLIEEQTTQPKKTGVEPQENTAPAKENTLKTQGDDNVTDQISTQVQQEIQDQKTLIFVKTFYDR